jgi:UDP-N-acetyl-D-glucosamine dehydrogenase
VRESPALDILRILESRGAKIAYSDPHVPELQWNATVLRSEDLMPAVRGADIVVIVTDHASFPYREIVDGAAVVLDTRNATRGIRAANVIKI